MVVARFFIIMMALFLPATTFAHTPSDPFDSPKLSQEKPMVLTADTVDFDSSTGIVTASGNVEILQGKVQLNADKVIYNKKTQDLVAVGNIRMIDDDGRVATAQYAELTNMMKEADIQNVKMLLDDDARLASKSAHRVDNNQLIMRKAVYTPCKVCKSDASKNPSWQLLAEEAIRDEQSQDIILKDITMTFFGMPMLYWPRISFPDPKVKRRSGFLAPHYAFTSDMGAVVWTPFYWSINPHQDLTLTPYFSIKRSPILAAEYRRQFVFGKLNFSGSVTDSKRFAEEKNTLFVTPEREENAIRWHGIFDTQFEMGDTWRAGADIKRVSDKTYLKRYRFFGMQNLSSLNSRIYTERFFDRDYLLIEGHAFQGLQDTDNSDTIPGILPAADYEMVRDFDHLGGKFFFNANILNLSRKVGTQMQRGIVKGTWNRPFLSEGGQIFDLNLSMRKDFYNISDFRKDDPDLTTPYRPLPKTQGFRTRIQPMAALNWRYPFVRHGKESSMVIEPLVGVVLSPHTRNSIDIPNEDSKLFEFDDTNLFRYNRFPGYDQIDNGPRANYGLQWRYYPETVLASSIFFGQSYRFRKSDIFARNTGIGHNFSDYVGRLEIVPANWFNARVRYRLDHNSFAVKRSDSNMTFSFSPFAISADHIFVHRALGTGQNKNLEQLGSSLTIKMGSFWTAVIDMRRDLVEPSKALTHGIGITYQDDCLKFQTIARRELYQDRDVRPGMSLLIILAFKNLGQIEQDLTNLLGGITGHNNQAAPSVDPALGTPSASSGATH